MSHLNEYELTHGFGDRIGPMSAYNVEIESTEHFLLRCHFSFFSEIRTQNLNKINPSFFKLSAKDQFNILLYGYSSNISILSQQISQGNN